VFARRAVPVGHDIRNNGAYINAAVIMPGGCGCCKKLLRSLELVTEMVGVISLPAIKREGKTKLEFSAAKKKILNEAYIALGGAVIPRSAFANAIHYMTIKTIKKQPADFPQSNCFATIISIFSDAIFLRKYI
jgi:hypothetical protein